MTQTPRRVYRKSNWVDWTGKVSNRRSVSGEGGEDGIPINGGRILHFYILRTPRFYPVASAASVPCLIDRHQVCVKGFGHFPLGMSEPTSSLATSEGMHWRRRRFWGHHLGPRCIINSALLTGLCWLGYRSLQPMSMTSTSLSWSRLQRLVWPPDQSVELAVIACCRTAWRSKRRVTYSLHIFSVRRCNCVLGCNEGRQDGTQPDIPVIAAL